MKGSKLIIKTKLTKKVIVSTMLFWSGVTISLLFTLSLYGVNIGQVNFSIVNSLLYVIIGLILIIMGLFSKLNYVTKDLSSIMNLINKKQLVEELLKK